MASNTPPISSNVVKLRVLTTKTGTTAYVYHTEYVPELVITLLTGWIGDPTAIPTIPDPNPMEGVNFERGELGKKTANPPYIDGTLQGGQFYTTGEDARRYRLDDSELTHID